MVRRTRNKKHRRSKRRTNRKQRGGAPPVTSIAQWIENVKAHPAYTKLDDKYKTLEYTMNDLKGSSLKLPNKPDDSTRVEPEWDVTLFTGNNQEEGPLDIRTLAANLYGKWGPYMGSTPSPTPANFKEYFGTYLKDDPAIKDQDQDFRVAAKYMLDTENNLRRGEAPIQELTEDANYPLLVWFLIMNQPDKPVKAEPSFIPLSEVKAELKANTEPSIEPVPSLLKEPET